RECRTALPAPAQTGSTTPRPPRRSRMPQRHRTSPAGFADPSSRRPSCRRAILPAGPRAPCLHVRGHTAAAAAMRLSRTKVLFAGQQARVTNEFCCSVQLAGLMAALTDGDLSAFCVEQRPAAQAERLALLGQPFVESPHAR